MKLHQQLLVGAVCAAVAGTAPSTARAQAPGADSPYVSKEEYLRLQKEHEQLKQEMRELRSLVQESLPKKAPVAVTGTGTAPGGTNAAAAATATADTGKGGAGGKSGEPDKSSEDALSLGRYLFPGSTRFLFSGYGSAGFSSLQHTDASFDAQFNPLMLWKINDRLLFEGELELELADGATETKLEQAHLSYLLNDFVTFDAGKFLNPMDSFVERYHMAWVNRLPDKPLAVYDGLLPETYLGAQLRGGAPIGSTRINYSAFVANAPKLITSVGPDDDVATLGTMDFDNFSNEGGRIATGAHVGYQFIPELELGYGMHYSGVADSDDRVLMQSIDLNYVRDSDALRGMLRFNAQWVWSHLGKGTYDDNGTAVTFYNNRNGGYAQVAYRPTKLASDFLRRMEAVFRYDRFNQAETPVGYDESRYTIGLNYWLTPKTVFKVAYQIDDKTGDAQNNSGIMMQFATGF